MKSLKIFGTLVVLITPMTILAQSINQSPVHGGGRQIVTKQKESDPAQGSMYINDKYLPAKINGQEKVLMLRYNAYQDSFEENNPQEEYINGLPKTPNSVIKFVGTNKTYAMTDFKDKDGLLSNGYLIVLCDTPKVKIYKREHITFVKETHPQNSYQSYKPARYSRGSDEFYISINGQPAILFDDKKDIISLMPERKKEINEYFKQNKLELESTENVNKLGNFLNTI
jgi:hypothetical protein